MRLHFNSLPLSTALALSIKSNRVLVMFTLAHVIRRVNNIGATILESYRKIVLVSCSGRVPIHTVISKKSEIKNETKCSDIHKSDHLES